MENPLTIPRPVMTDAMRLTPLQLNAIRVGQQHTVLTPERLKRNTHSK